MAAVKEKTVTTVHFINSHELIELPPKENKKKRYFWCRTCAKEGTKFVFKRRKCGDISGLLGHVLTPTGKTSRFPTKHETYRELFECSFCGLVLTKHGFKNRGKRCGDNGSKRSFHI